MTISLVISLYNESRRLHLLHACLLNDITPNSDFLEVILVNDGSTDGTSYGLRELQSLHPKIKLIETQRNRGKGAGIRTGIAATTGAFVLTSDADIATPISEYTKLLNASNPNVGLVIGSRRHIGFDKRESQPLLRRLIGTILIRLTKSLFFASISDTQSGFKLYNGTVIRSILGHCHINGFLFDLELLLYIIFYYRLHVREISVDWTHNDFSTVSLNFRALSRLTIDFLRLLARRFSLMHSTKRELAYKHTNTSEAIT